MITVDITPNEIGSMVKQVPSGAVNLQDDLEEINEAININRQMIISLVKAVTEVNPAVAVPFLINMQMSEPDYLYHYDTPDKRAKEILLMELTSGLGDTDKILYELRKEDLEK